VTVMWVERLGDGHLVRAEIEAALRAAPADGPRLVAIHAVHHETGAIQPVRAIVLVAERWGAEVHLDAVQAAGRVPEDAWHGAHSLALAAHKLRGPKGIGALVTRPGIAVRPLLVGGAQERGLRPGTLDPVAAAGFGVAARRARSGPERFAALGELRDGVEERLLRSASAHAVPVAITTSAPRAPHVSHATVAGWRGDELVAALDLEGVCVSSGSACAAGTAEPSPAIAAILGVDRASSSVRISLGETSTWDDVDALENALQRVLSRTGARP
jgi:cysteine desulfurase